MTQRCFCVFEGGGAKGIAHLGFLKAIEDDADLEVAGYAGTSAGAIVASLAAVGWRSEELLSFQSDTYRSKALEEICDPRIKRLPDVLGSRQWFAVRICRIFLTLAKRREKRSERERARITKFYGFLIFFLASLLSLLILPWLPSASGINDLIIWIIASFSLFVLVLPLLANHAALRRMIKAASFFLGISKNSRTPPRLSLLDSLGYIFSLTVLIGACCVILFSWGSVQDNLRLSMLILWILLIYSSLYTIWRVFRRFRGLTDLKNVRRIINHALASKLSLDPARSVSFQDVMDSRGMKLKVVAGSISSGEMKVFSTDTTPHESVADAVIASAAIPFIFKPVRVGVNEYCDGGMVSNLPAWTFDADMLIDNECLLITSEIEDIVEVSSSRIAGLILLKKILGLSIFGAHKLNTRGLLTHIKLPARPTIGLLDFDDMEGLCSDARKAHDAATGLLGKHQVDRSAAVGIMESVRDLCQEFGLEGCRVRVAMWRPVNLVDQDPVAYFSWYCVNFDRCPDKRMAVSAESSLVGYSVSEAEPHFVDLLDEDDREAFFAYEQKGIPSERLDQSLKWAIAIPLDGPHRRHELLSTCVSVDGDVPLPWKREEFLSAVCDVVEHETDVENREGTN